jgi:hypothetical protein
MMGQPRSVPPRLDAVDPDMAKVFEAKSGMDRLRIAHEAWRQARERLMAFLAAEHPEWGALELSPKFADALISNGLVRSTPPFSEKVPVKGVTWLEPRLTPEVSYAEILHGGSLRAGVFRGGFVGG